MEKEKKRNLLREIEGLLAKYGTQSEIDPYVLEYLSSKDLEKIKEELIEKQKRVIETNHEWLMQFKKEKS